MLNLLMNRYNKLFVLALFAVAFGYLEAAVVIYLRELYFAGNFVLPMKAGFPFIHFGSVPALQVIPLRIFSLEVAREAATLAMLLTLAYLSGRTVRERWAYFLWLFGLWRICYYAFLKLVLGWPASFGTADVLSLIPVPWTAPVGLPLAASCLMLAVTLYLMETEQ